MTLRQIITEELNVIKRNFYNELINSISNKLEDCVQDNDDLYLSEGKMGKDFYDSIATKGYKKKEIFTVKIPIALLADDIRDKAKSISKSASIETEIPIDLSVVNRLMSEYVEAKEKNDELFSKYKTWANWYTDFNKIIFDALPESDACLFLSAIAFCSANTSIDRNVVEAAKVFIAVKTDFGRGNSGKEVLKFISTHINSLENNDSIKMLSKLSTANSSYANLLFPKKSMNSNEKIKEISVSATKLLNYNKFVKYYLNNNGKLKKSKMLIDLKNGDIKISGNKIYSFLLNVIDPNYEWTSVDGISINPSTIDTWMIRMFFTVPIGNLVNELQNDELINPGKAVHNHMISSCIKDIASSDDAKSTIVKILNDEASKYDMKAHELQAFVWVKFREEHGIQKPQFSSFVDIINYIHKIQDKIDVINPKLSFIKKDGMNIKSETYSVLSTIVLLSKITQWTPSQESKIEKTLQNVYNYQRDLSPNIKKHSKKSKDIINYIIKLKRTSDTEWSGIIRIKGNKNELHTIFGINMKDVINKSKRWILNHTPDNMKFDIDVKL